MRVVCQGDLTPYVGKTRHAATVYEYFGSRRGRLGAGPQVFLADKPDGDAIVPHFHDVDQFQVFVRGHCRLGRTPMEPVAFHYADAFTPYGPIIGDAQGFAFFTIRAGHASGVFDMPLSRHLLPEGAPGRNVLARFEVGDPCRAPGEIRRSVLLDRQADGMRAVGWRLGPNASAGGEVSDAGSQFYLVCAGELLAAGCRIPRLSLLHVQAGEPTPLLQSGPEGADVLFMQFPVPGKRPGSDPGRRGAHEDFEYRIPPSMVEPRRPESNGSQDISER